MSYIDIVESIPATTEHATLRLDRNRLLLSELGYNSLQNLLVGGLFAIFFSRYNESSLVWVWWVGFAVVVLVRAAALRWLQSADLLDEPSRSTVIYSCIGATALAWGMAPLCCAAPSAEMMFMLAVSWVAIVVIGGANAFHADPFATAALALPATVPVLIVLVINQDPAALPIAAAIGLVYAHLTVSNIRARRARDIELRLKRENAQLMQKYRKQARWASQELDRRLHIERELRAARHRAERLSSLDGLTGIANRRYFDEQLNAELGRAFRAQKPLSVILMDVDCFKQYNDLYGHGVGDDCLAEIGKILARFARRSGDLAARYGGEEFVLLLPESPREAAMTIAEDIRRAIVACDIAHDASDVAAHVTASFGVATLIPTADNTPRQLVDAADNALYEAKKAGRDRIVAAG